MACYSYNCPISIIAPIAESPIAVVASVLIQLALVLEECEGVSGSGSVCGVILCSGRCKPFGEYLQQAYYITMFLCLTYFLLPLPAFWFGSQNQQGC